MALNRNWTKEETEELISLYESFPELWNNNLKDYKNRFKKKIAWQTLAETFNRSETEVHRKIHNLRCQFHLEIQKIRDNAYKEPNKKLICKWHFFEALQFIKLSTIPRKSSKRNTDFCKIINSEPVEIKIENSKNSINKRKLDDTTDIEEVIPDEYTCKKNTNTDCEPRSHQDSYEVFGTFVAAELRDLQHDHFKKKLKIMIQKCILEVAEEDLTCSSNESRSPSSDGTWQ